MKQKLFFFITIIALLSSCKVSKNVSEIKETTKIDSVFIYKEKEVVKRILDTLTIKEPCDTISGLLKDFEKEINTTKAKIKLKSVKGNIVVSVDIDSIVNSKIIQFKQNYKQTSEVKTIEIIKYRTPLYMWLIIIILCGVIYFLIRF